MKKTIKKMNALKDKLIEITYRLVSPTDISFSMASCFIYQPDSEQENLYVITAGHTLSVNGSFIETHEKSEDGNPLLINAGRFSIFYNHNDIDYAFSKLPLQMVQQQLPTATRFPLNVYRGPFRTAVQNEAYGFAVLNNYELLRAGDQLLMHKYECVEMCMELESQSDHINHFRLARERREHEFYRGASGSPIADPEGAICSILIGAEGELLRGFRLDNIDLVTLIEQADALELRNGEYPTE